MGNWEPIGKDPIELSTAKGRGHIGKDLIGLSTIKGMRFNIGDLVHKRVSLATRNPVHGKLGPN